MEPNHALQKSGNLYRLSGGALPDHVICLSEQNLPEDLEIIADKANQAFTGVVQAIIEKKIAGYHIARELLKGTSPIVEEVRAQLLNEYSNPNLLEAQPAGTYFSYFNQAIKKWMPDLKNNYFYKMMESWMPNLDLDKKNPALTDEEYRTLGTREFREKVLSLPSFDKARELFPKIKEIASEQAKMDVPKLLAVIKTLSIEQINEILSQDEDLQDSLTYALLENPVDFVPRTNTNPVNFSTAVNYLKTTQHPPLHPFSKEPIRDIITAPDKKLEVMHEQCKELEDMIQKAGPDGMKKATQDLIAMIENDPKIDADQKLDKIIQAKNDLKKIQMMINLSNKSPFLKTGLAAVQANGRVEGRELFKEFLNHLSNQYNFLKCLENIYLEKLNEQAPGLHPFNKINGSPKDNLALITNKNPQVMERMNKLAQQRFSLGSYLADGLQFFIDRTVADSLRQLMCLKKDDLIPLDSRNWEEIEISCNG